MDTTDVHEFADLAETARDLLARAATELPGSPLAVAVREAIDHNDLYALDEAADLLFVALGDRCDYCGEDAWWHGERRCEDCARRDAAEDRCDPEDCR